MESHSWTRTISALALFLFLLLQPAGAFADPPKVGRVRPEGPALRQVLEAGIARSSTLRSMLEHIEGSNVIAYLRCHQFLGSILKGRTYLVASKPSVRYVFVEVWCHDADQTVLMVMAHELRHVVEIASSPWVADDESLGRLYSRIGFSTCGWGAPAQFETNDAIETGMRVRREFLNHEASRLSARMHSD